MIDFNKRMERHERRMKLTGCFMITVCLVCFVGSVIFFGFLIGQCIKGAKYVEKNGIKSIWESVYYGENKND